MALIEEEVPMLETGEVLVRITHAGLCGSDLRLDFHGCCKTWGCSWSCMVVLRHYFRHGGLGSFKTALPMYMGHEPVAGQMIPNWKKPVEVTAYESSHRL